MNLAKHAFVAAAAFCPLALPAQTTPAFIQGEMPNLLQTYKQIHAHPELSHHEEQTSALLAGGLRAAGYTVTEHVGVYPDGSHAFGVVGLLKNGAGPTLLIRGDMDALPIVEETGVPYASHVQTKNSSGQEVGVMHACGHDVHTTVLLGTARALAAAKDKWHGTVMIVGQPSEETIDGAKAMLADHMYERFGRPDKVIGLHDTNQHPAGTVALTSGAAMASSTSIDVVMRGIGGHGAEPQLGRDPITMSAMFIAQLQTIVSREEDPNDPVVVTIGDIHGGTKRNIIPDEVKMELTARSFNDHAREVTLSGIRRMAAGVAQSYGIPAAKAPTVTVLDAESTPVLFNDPAMSAQVKDVLIKTLGAANVADQTRALGSEDVGVFGLEGHKIPVVYFWLGAMDPVKFTDAQSEGKLLPGMHTSRFQPDPEPTIRTGVTALTAVAESELQ